MASVAVYALKNGYPKIALGSEKFLCFGDLEGEAIISQLIGTYQDVSFVSSSSFSNIEKTNNVSYVSASGAYIYIDGAFLNSKIEELPNALATLNISLTNSIAITTSNSSISFYFDSNKQTIKSYESIHVGTGLTMGSGTSDWTTHVTNTGTMDLRENPGLSGANPTGSSSSSTTHDWYLAIAQSPNDVFGKSEYSIIFSTEYV